MHPLAQQLLTRIRRPELFSAGDRVGVAVSGGIDSVALLRLLLELRFELGIVLSVVHFNHKLRGAESDADGEFVRKLAREHDLEFYVDQADVAAHAQEAGVSLETAARELRYGFFRSLIRGSDRAEEVKDPTLSQNTREGRGNLRDGSSSGAEAPKSFLAPDGAAESRALSNQSKLDKIATGHTLDDQAETVLMRMIRGAGMRGLGAIYPRIEVEDDDSEHGGAIVRPLLGNRRCELEGYLNDIDQSWREDSTNADHHFTRNRVRKLLVPLLEKEFNPKIAQGLSELAEIAREEEDYWENEIAGWMGTVVRWSESQSPAEFVQIQPAGSTLEDSPDSLMKVSVERLWFLGEPVAVQRRLIKAIAEEAGIPLEFRHVDEIVRFAAESEAEAKQIVLPLGWKLQRESGELVFLAPGPHQEGSSADYEYSVALPARVVVSEIGSEFELRTVECAGDSTRELDSLLAADVLRDTLTIRNWHAGDRFWPAHTKAPKKIKQLLTDLHVAHTAKASWPVVVSGDEIVWVRGWPVSLKHQAKAGERAVLIREIAADEP